MLTRPATAADLPAILAIANHAISKTTAWYEETPKSEADMAAWLEEKHAGGWPVMVAEADDAVLGYATLGTFRTRACYRQTAEHSVYVSEAARGRGAGRALIGAIVEEAKTRDLHALVGGVDSENEGSIAFHRALGFTEVGRLPEIGRKFDRWLTLVFMQKILGD